MNRKDATLIGVETTMSGIVLMQRTPRQVHEIVSNELARRFVGVLKEQVAGLYDIVEDKLTAKHPAYVYQRRYWCDSHSDAVTYGVQLHVLSREELKAIIDEELKEVRDLHRMELAKVRCDYDRNVKEAAKRLLEKASL